jgi:hypothetical protein
MRSEKLARASEAEKPLRSECDALAPKPAVVNEVATSSLPPPTLASRTVAPKSIVFETTAWVRVSSRLAISEVRSSSEISYSVSPAVSSASS